MIQTVSREGRSFAVECNDGQRIVMDGEDFYLVTGSYRVRVAWPELGFELSVRDFLWLGEPERCS